LRAPAERGSRCSAAPDGPLPILGRGEALRYGKQGKRAGQASKRADDKAYIVGTFTAKATWYGFLRSTLAYAAAIVEEGSGARGRRASATSAATRPTTGSTWRRPRRSSPRSSTAIRGASGR
jgi:hypothetical protein